MRERQIILATGVCILLIRSEILTIDEASFLEIVSMISSRDETKQLSAVVKRADDSCFPRPCHRRPAVGGQSFLNFLGAAAAFVIH
jgi:hypothetical protein